jgi:hypothetical protein
MGIDFSVKVVGADQALKALRVLEPSVARKVGREISSIGVGLAAAIRSMAPSEPPVSGWQETSGAKGSRSGAGWPKWSQAQASSRRRGTTAIVTMTSDPLASVSFAESLGRGTEWQTKAGLNLVKYARLRWSPIVKAGKKEGRVARAAVAENYPEILSDLQKAVDMAVNEVNRRMP